jgi:hypothetical protein
MFSLLWRVSVNALFKSVTNLELTLCHLKGVFLVVVKTISLWGKQVFWTRLLAR